MEDNGKLGTDMSSTTAARSMCHGREIRAEVNTNAVLPRGLDAARVAAPVQEAVRAEALKQVQPLPSTYVPVPLLLYLGVHTTVSAT
jgi:hypothetical protein